LKQEKQFLNYYNFKLKIALHHFFFLGRNVEYFRFFKYNEYINTLPFLRDQYNLKDALKIEEFDNDGLYLFYRWNLIKERFSPYMFLSDKRVN